ncbi:hypothetical protein [Corynebacterium sp. p3-SID1194]|uniref:hypothetical protein n=1 Tax=Corynebacterium sp. p3-SID1194 TaxID=2916105 RepID=UPI0021A48CB7|nr:hypothetical protein [Corynebacterium sp. p3-SID1194]MCT1450614.1 hypothetical protein [Corynebacterium sp. p3-SID1194]
MEHTEWMKRVTRGDSYRRVAELAGVNDRTLANQMRAGELRPELVIKIAEAYEESPVIALVDLGFMSARWITEPGVVTALSRATDEQLTDELLRRLRLIEDVPVDELAQRRSNTSEPGVQVEGYAANRRQAEPEEGDDDYGPGA